jgi:O-antigen ligase
VKGSWKTPVALIILMRFSTWAFMSTAKYINPDTRRALAAWPPSRVVAVGALVPTTIAVGWLCASKPTVAVALGAALFVTFCVVRSPVAILGFVFAALASEWLFEANQAGIITFSSRVGSVVTWSIILLIAALPVWMSRRHLLAPGVMAGVGIYSLGLAFSVAVDAVNGNNGNIVSGLEALAVATIPFSLAVCLQVTKSNTGLRLVALYVLVEGIYCAFQLGELRFNTGTTQLFIVGNQYRWWDSRALWGTFAAAGNHAFANSLALCCAVTLPWAFYGSRGRMRTVLAVVSGLAILLVLMSLARAPVLSLIVVVGLTFIFRSRRSRVLPGMIVLIVAGIAVQSSQFAELAARAHLDTSSQQRLTIYQAVTSAPPSSFIFGQGFGTASKFDSVITTVKAPGNEPSGPATEDLFLRRLVEGGMLGLLSLLAFFGLLLREGTRRVSDHSGQVWRLALRCFTLALIVQSLTSDTLIFQQEGAVAWLLLGVIAAGLMQAGDVPVRVDHK